MKEKLPPPPTEVPRLSRQEWKLIYDALLSLEALQKSDAPKLITPGGPGRTNRADDIAGLTHYLAEQLIKHGPELLSCWLVVRDEYEPLCNVFTRITMRVSTNLANVTQQ